MRFENGSQNSSTNGLHFPSGLELVQSIKGLLGNVFATKSPKCAKVTKKVQGFSVVVFPIIKFPQHLPNHKCYKRKFKKSHFIALRLVFSI